MHNPLYKTHTSSATCVATGSSTEDPSEHKALPVFSPASLLHSQCFITEQFQLKIDIIFFSLIQFSTLGCSSHTPDPADQRAALAPRRQRTHTRGPLPKPWDVPGALGKDNSIGTYAESKVAQVA